ncbi:TerD family protein, partial [Streptomyces phytophilus]|uniref:TerD family protein n=1 Tax=Streptomyces phytophilus TaxID=722715 RepID=UPI0015F07C2A
MHEMTKGSNVRLAALGQETGSVFVNVGWSSGTGDSDTDVSVLLLDGSGRVRGDADFYFYNNPAAADGSVQLLGKTPTANGSADRIGIDLTAIPAAVERIVVAASRYGGAHFGDLEDIRMTLADGAGEELLGFSVPDAGAVSAFLFGEVYRREGDWKFRAIGQGYESGLAGLATDFGIDVDDDAEAVEQAPGTDGTVREETVRGEAGE